MRPGNVYGPGSLHWTERPAALIQKNLFSLPRACGPSNTVFVDNVCSLLAECVHNEAASGQTFHVVDEGLRSWHDFFGAYARALGERIPVRPLGLLSAAALIFEQLARVTRRPPLASREALAYLLSQAHFPMDKAARVLGWHPPISAEDGMARTLLSLRLR